MSQLWWDIAARSDRGNVRKINEDALLVVSNGPLLAVADGMGGHQAGEVASRMITEALTSMAPAPALLDAREQLEAALQHANQAILDYGTRELAGVTIGSTVVAMTARGAQAVCLWAGDSRLYRLRHGELQQLTDDHSYVAEMVRQGLLNQEEARNHPSANMITRAIGVVAPVELSCAILDVETGDTYLLCSDGLTNEVAEEELCAALSEPDVHASADHLLQLCLSRAARDNVSFIIARSPTHY